MPTPSPDPLMPPPLENRRSSKEPPSERGDLIVGVAIKIQMRSPTDTPSLSYCHDALIICDWVLLHEGHCQHDALNNHLKRCQRFVNANSEERSRDRKNVPRGNSSLSILEPLFLNHHCPSLSSTTIPEAEAYPRCTLRETRRKEGKKLSPSRDSSSARTRS